VDVRPVRSIVIPSSPGDDRRQQCRLKVERPCRVYPVEHGSEGVHGVTNDISRSGLLIAFPRGVSPWSLPKVGEHARIVIDLPNGPGAPARSLEHLARVVRVSGEMSESPTVAFEVYRTRITDRGDGATAGGEWPAKPISGYVQ